MILPFTWLAKERKHSGEIFLSRNMLDPWASSLPERGNTTYQHSIAEQRIEEYHQSI